MSPDSGANEASPAEKQVQKRSRVLLSCAPCRNSKLKCDRQQPCSHCEKKSRIDQCVYAPKPVKKKQATKNMTARLKRLEGLVRGMMDDGGDSQAPQEGNKGNAVPSLQGHVVQGERGTAYVGATHCMAMLEDIEDLKLYFDESEEQEEGASPTDELDGAEMLLLTGRAPTNRDDLIAQLPERHVTDRLITRYFSSMSPSQHIVHKPTFTRAYAQFWLNPTSVSLHWLAQLFMMLALGTFYNKFSAPHELSGDSPVPVLDRIKQYRSCASWALFSGKYTQPTTATLPAFVLYVESHFLLDRASQMNCYILSGVCIRLLLKMGLHRDPSKLANISPYESEMRRRLWNMAMQIELLVSFHMGLPSTLQGIESDTQIPYNIQDEDFDEFSTTLPPERSFTDHTHMTYPINKSRILRVFGKIAAQAHSLSPPSYADVLKLDATLQETWSQLPNIMRVRPLDECVGDSPILLTQRFGLQALYNKSRCVLHRRYLAEAIPQTEHNFSRQQCLDAALNLLDQQCIIWRASKPGGVLNSTSWFLSSLAVHDYLLAAMIVYLATRNDKYPDAEAGFYFEGRRPSKDEMKGLLKRSYVIWTDVSDDVKELRKTADMLAGMLAKLGDAVDRSEGFDGMHSVSGSGSGANSIGSLWSTSGPQSASGKSGDSNLLSTFVMDSTNELPPRNSSSGLTPFSMPPASSSATPAVDLTSMPPGADFPSTLDFDASWMNSADNMDWRFLDVSLSHNHATGLDTGAGQTWVEKLPLGDFNMMDLGVWGNPPGE
ncbi:hypothetical protein QQS21_003357 [Conoideocrella luteorostrata]|uniref:Zn(2)-C6 fungal-type domain-containing protein n=1 Tax=Conoideocrella luteorostrata TaxID=1105319 RepID=A0AAJ0CTB9_9HYPO|nr:hypothetical protein QQS21_003357 [Conoideocrella luteorostrata]